MEIMMVLKSAVARDAKVMVGLRNEGVRKQVISLIGKDKAKEAFDLLRVHAEPKEYVPAGQSLPKRAVLLTLDEYLIDKIEKK